MGNTRIYNGASHGIPRLLEAPARSRRQLAVRRWYRSEVLLQRSEPGTIYPAFGRGMMWLPLQHRK